MSAGHDAYHLTILARPRSIKRVGTCQGDLPFRGAKSISKSVGLRSTRPILFESIRRFLQRVAVEADDNEEMEQEQQPPWPPLHVARGLTVAWDTLHL